MAGIIARAAVGILLCAGTAAAQLSNLSGTWILNAERSRWGKMLRPLNVLVEIVHKEPALRYCGLVTYANEEVRNFCFEGAVDGKQYAVERSYGRGTMLIRRLDALSVLTTYTSADGRYAETSVTTVSRDGKSLIRRMSLKSPVGDRTWIEKYEKVGP